MIAFEIKEKALKEMSQIRNPIAAVFENFDFVVEALDKAAGLAIDEEVSDLVKPTVQGRQETVKQLSSLLLTPFIQRLIASFADCLV